MKVRCFTYSQADMIGSGSEYASFRLVEKAGRTYLKLETNSWMFLSADEIDKFANEMKSVLSGVGKDAT